jgi:hypothetical protein
MSSPDRAKGFAVILERDLPDRVCVEDMERLLLAIRGVKEVVPLGPDDAGDQVTAERVKHELWEQVHKVFFPKAEK